MAWSLRDVLKISVRPAPSESTKLAFKDEDEDPTDIWEVADYVIAWLPIVLSWLLLLVLIFLMG